MSNEQSLNGTKTDDELFAEIQATLREGSEQDLNKLMEVEEEVVVEEKKGDPIPEGTPPETKEEKPKTSAETPPESQEKDWLAELPEEVQAKVKALKDERDQFEHRVKSELGRVPALQRKVEELSRKLSDPRPAPKPAEESQKDAAKSSKLQEKLAQIRLIDPLLADLLEDMQGELVQPLRSEFDAKIESTAQAVRQREEQELWEREAKKLTDAVPQAFEVFKLPAYREWVKVQTEGVQTLAASVYADDVLVVLEKFAKEMQPKQQPATPAPAKPSVAPPNKVEQERSRKLSSAVPTGGGVTPKPTNGEPDDPEALFHYYREKLKKGEI